MGRLTYVNRKIEGVKVGQVIAKDLLKRIPPSAGSKAALRDPVVEIDASSKLLGDDGIREFVPGLVQSVLYGGDHGPCTVLEDLCLRENRLSVRSLETLTPLLRLASHDLRDLDLSRNTIEVKDPQDTRIWEDFLLALSTCSTLRRLDLSGNPLGSKAFEILAKTFVHEKGLKFPTPSSMSSHEGMGSGIAEDIAEQAKESQVLEQEMDKLLIANHLKAGNMSHEGEQDGKFSKNKSNKPEANSTASPLQATGKQKVDVMCGLTNGIRSIPYIVLSDTSMSDTGALYLSYVLSSHLRPKTLLQFVPAARPGPALNQLNVYDNESKCSGLIYLPNSSLGHSGLKVLDLAEALRRPEDLDTDTVFSDGQGSNLTAQAGEWPARHTPHRSGHPPISKGHHRRTSTHDMGHSSSACVSLSDIERARSRIQGEILNGPHRLSNDLWRIALTMLVLGRTLQLGEKKKPRPSPQVQGWPSLPAVASPPIHAPSLTSQEFPKAPIVRTLEIPGLAVKKSATPTPLGMSNPNKKLRARSVSMGKAMAPPPVKVGLAGKTDVLASPREQRRERLSKWTNKPYRSNFRHGLAEDTWRRILALAVGADGIVSERQQHMVLKWAMNTETLKQEQEWLGLQEGLQIWHVLDSMQCLAYERDE